jgi:hypothetical protein
LRNDLRTASTLSLVEPRAVSDPPVLPLRTASAVPRQTLATSLDGFCVSWLTAQGRERQARLQPVAEEPFEEALPCRRYPAYRGQRYFPGHYWLATTGWHVGYESLLERAHLTLLDFDPDVVAVAAQPFALLWPEGRRLVRHIPDFFVRHADGSASLVDVKPRERVSERDRVVFAAVGRRALRWAGRIACAMSLRRWYCATWNGWPATAGGSAMSRRSPQSW